MAFRKLGIHESVIRSIEEQRFEKPTEIQNRAIPLVLQGKDVIAGSATGSGKTLVFGSAIIQHSERGAGIQALVLTPTRELAEQVAKSLKRFSKHKPLEIIAVYGGVSMSPQIAGLRTADVVVGTPGRLLDHIGRRTIDLRVVKMLVLDEADRMLDMGFIRDVEQIIRTCPQKRQTLLFSATITPEVARLSYRYMKDPIKVSAEQYVDPRKLTQVYYDVTDENKFSLLVHLLKNEKSGLVMVFCNTRRTTDFVANNLKLAGVDAMAIHGGFSQDQRDKTMQMFHSQKALILVCTDVAARGLDIKEVSHVYNYDIPKDSKDYVHRIGRTARAGAEGRVVNLLSNHDYDSFTRVLRGTDFNIVKQTAPHYEKVHTRWVQKRSFYSRGFGDQGRRNYGRGSQRGWVHSGKRYGR